jgi:hypothetical protein
LARIPYGIGLLDLLNYDTPALDRKLHFVARLYICFPANFSGDRRLSFAGDRATTSRARCGLSLDRGADGADFRLERPRGQDYAVWRGLVAESQASGHAGFGIIRALLHPQIAARR